MLVSPRTALIALLAVLALSGQAAAAAAESAQTSMKIAVVEFENLSDEAKTEKLGRTAAEMFTTAAVNSGFFEVVEREQIRKVLDEMEFGESGKTSTGTAQKIGAMVGAAGVLSGSVTTMKDSVRFDARLIRVTDGKVLAAEKAYAKNDLQSIGNAAESALLRMVGTLFPEARKKLEKEAAQKAAQQPAAQAPAAPKPAPKPAPQAVQPAPQPAAPPAPQAAPAPAPSIEGRYSALGQNPNGSTYRGTAVISRSGNGYVISWSIAGQSFSGAGQLRGNILTIQWTGSGGGGGVVIYSVTPSGVLQGVWADGAGRETLTPMP